MQRLLQGDVGSGKTAVALYTLLRAVEGGRQGALMAPTETLAEQHFLTIEGLCAVLGVRVALLTSSITARERRAAHQLVASGDVGIAVGTHALIQREVEFADLAVAVVDEQHRFGVEQRAALAEGRSPHVLHMTATPIPRTLALTVYGDLAVSEIAAPPANRKPIVTAWVSEERSAEAYARLRRHLDDGRQAYVVCPLVEGSETTLARAAEDEAERLRTNELRDYRVGCVHGRLKTAERRARMAAFTAGELDVLVATTVIEVGVDVPNATIMIVQEADRFGLAQLHQLRGRVGRGAEQSYCLLVSRHRDELSEVGRRAARGDGRRRPTASSSPSATSRSAARASSSGRASRASPTFASPVCAPTATSSSARRSSPPTARGETFLDAESSGSSARPSTSASRKPSRAVRPMRIIAGTHRGSGSRRRRVAHTRPTGDRVREALFNLVGPVDGASVLDLYAGSGALGLEALSRGARRCVFVETDGAACRAIRANLETLGLTGGLVTQRDALAVLREERTGRETPRAPAPRPALRALAGARAAARRAAAGGRRRGGASSSWRRTHASSRRSLSTS